MYRLVLLSRQILHTQHVIELLEVKVVMYNVDNSTFTGFIYETRLTNC